MGREGKRYSSQLKLRKGSETHLCLTENGGSWRENEVEASKDKLNNCIFFLLIILGKEIKKSKLIRSQSFNNQAFHAKYGNLDKCARYDLAVIHIFIFIL